MIRASLGISILIFVAFAVAQEAPKPPALTEPSAHHATLSVEISSAPIGEPVANFTSRTPQIYVRWQGHDLPDDAKIRAAWIAEDVGEAAASGTKIDEASTTATDPESYGTFTLSRPEGGWPPGNYRVELYLADQLAAMAKCRIEK